MAKEWGTIADHLKQFALGQKVFFIATASGDDDVNLSPKGLETFRVIDDKTVSYADFHGSGNQTAKHLSEGGKATITFMSFGEKPLILRFYATGRVLEPGAAEFAKLLSSHYGEIEEQYIRHVRQIFLFDVYRVQTSCGYGVPIMNYVSDRREQPYFRELLGLE